MNFFLEWRRQVQIMQRFLGLIDKIKKPRKISRTRGVNGSNHVYLLRDAHKFTIARKMNAINRLSGILVPYFQRTDQP